MSALSGLLGKVVSGAAGEAATVATGGSLPMIIGSACLALGLALGGSGAWWLQDNRYSAEVGTLKATYANAMKVISDKAAKDADDKARQLIALQGQIGLLDARHYQEMQDAQAANDKLRVDVAAGARRLSIAARCPNPGGGNGLPGSAAAAGMGDGAVQRCELDPAAAARVLSVGADGDRALTQLRACQDYARTISAPRQ